MIFGFAPSSSLPESIVEHNYLIAIVLILVWQGRYGPAMPGLVVTQTSLQ